MCIYTFSFFFFRVNQGKYAIYYVVIFAGVNSRLIIQGYNLHIMSFQIFKSDILATSKIVKWSNENSENLVFVFSFLSEKCQFIIVKRFLNERGERNE